jgi:hypothetical protein
MRRGAEQRKAIDGTPQRGKRGQMLSTEQLSDAEFFALMIRIPSLALGGLLLVIVWPIEAGQPR